MADHDLSFVAPHRRAEVLRRIRTVQAFLAAPGRAAAEAAADSLGLRPTQFYRLVRVWREHRRPDLMAGSARPRALRSLASPEQSHFVEIAIAELGDAPIEAVSIRAIQIAAAAGTAMPVLTTVRKMVELRRCGRVSSSSPAFGCDIVITTCAIDIAVAVQDINASTMPIATLVIDARSQAAVVGAALGLAPYSPATCASALLSALTCSHSAAGDAKPITIALPRHSGPVWSDLTAGLRSAGCPVRETGPVPHSVTHDAIALLGRKPAGFGLRPGLTTKPPTARVPTHASGAVPLGLDEAEELFRSRLVDPGTPSLLCSLDDVKRRKLTDLLTIIVQRSGS